MLTPDLPPVNVLPPTRKTLVSRALEHWRSLSAGQRRRLTGLFVFGAILTLAFIKPLASLMIYASGTELHSHILLIPFVSIYLLCIKRQALPGDLRTSRGWGIAMAAAGLAFLGAAWYWQVADPALSRNDRHVFPVLAFISLLTAGGFFFLGQKWMAVAAFPVAFLLFMVPLPDVVAHGLETASQHASAEAANAYFSLAGVPFMRDEMDGTVFHLPGISPIKVAQECSGIRSSLVLFITSLIASHMFLNGTWRRIIFVSLVIPLGILRNGFRILVIGWLCVEKGPHMMDHWIHHRGGPVFFGLSLIPLFLVLWWLRRGEVRRLKSKG